VIAASAGVIVASAVILVTLLSRFSKIVQEADKSTRLAKDVWDSMNSRFSVVDARIIDLMAKTDVFSSRLGSSQFELKPHGESLSKESLEVRTKQGDSQRTVVMAPAARLGDGTETEVKVLRLLVNGSRSSAQIKDELGKSREHTARLMKGLFDRGLVLRNDRNKPYVYEITESGKSYVAS
jgi:DNA-binding CsgD family transcriptional regulator